MAHAIVCFCTCFLRGHANRHTVLILGLYGICFEHTCALFKGFMAHAVAYLCFTLGFYGTCCQGLGFRV